jgi:ABC-type sugar transport system permease subunit
LAARDETRIGVALVAPLIILEFLVCLFPLGYSLWLSFQQGLLFGGSSSFAGLSNYLAVGADTFIAPAAIVSLRFVAETTILVFCLSLGMALLLNEDVKGQSLLRVIVILPWSLSEFAVALSGRFFLDSNYGFLNSILVELHLVKSGILFLNAQNGVEWASLFYAWNFAPIGAIFILSSLQTIPELLYRAARIDGASTLMKFRTVTFPFVRYSILITLVLATIQSAGAVVIFYALTGGGPGVATTSISLYAFKVFFNMGQYGYGAAISWLALVFIATGATAYFYLLMRRR